MANVMNFFEVSNVINNYAANNASTRMGHNFVCVVSLKDSRVYASGRHLIGHVAKVTMVNHALFPKYDSKVSAITCMPKVASNELKGMTWLIYPYIKKSNKSGYSYLNVYYGIGDVRMEVNTKWLWNGKEATTQQIAEIERHLKPNSNGGLVKAMMYQIEPTNSWDGFYYFGEDKSKSRQIYESIGK